MIAFSLNNNISCQQICHNIEKLLESYKNKNPQHQDLMLVIHIKNVSQEKTFEKSHFYLEYHPYTPEGTNYEKS
jgi:flagellar biosynthesis protein FliP